MLSEVSRKFLCIRCAASWLWRPGWLQFLRWLGVFVLSMAPGFPVSAEDVTVLLQLEGEPLADLAIRQRAEGAALADARLQATSRRSQVEAQQVRVAAQLPLTARITDRFYKC